MAKIGGNGGAVCSRQKAVLSDPRFLEGEEKKQNAGLAPGTVMYNVMYTFKGTAHLGLASHAWSLCGLC